MKTNNFKRIATVFAIMAITMVSVNSLFAQFTGATQVDQTAIEERKGDLSTYTIPGPAGDEYSWQIEGPAGITITPAPDGGIGTAGDPYVLNYAVGLQSITVQWVADDNTITSLARNVSVQRKVAATGDCPSAIQSMDISLWSNPTIGIQDADYEICSGDATLGPITVDFTGAPNFAFKYTITDLAGATGVDQVVTGETGATATIALPANLVNTSTTLDQTYIVTLTEMYDGFTGLGTISDATFTITVHPTIETGDIISDNILTRR